MVSSFADHIFCNSRGQDAEVVTVEVLIYKQCVALDAPGALIARITPQDQSEKGVTFKDSPTPLELKNASSTTTSSSLFNGSEVTCTVSVQRNAFSKIYDQIQYGQEYQEVDNQPGWEELIKGDQLGVRMPRYSVEILMKAGVTLTRKLWLPDSEIMVASETTLAAGNPYSRDLTIKAQAYDDEGNRYIERVRR